MKRSVRKGQSTLEYVIILAAVVGAIVAVAALVNSKLTSPEKGYGKLIGDMGTSVETLGNKITGTSTTSGTSTSGASSIGPGSSNVISVPGGSLDKSTGLSTKQP